MTDFDWFIIVVAQCISWYMGYRHGLYTAARRIVDRLLEDPKCLEKDLALLKALKDKEALDQTKIKAIRVRVEHHGDQLYLWAEDSNEFLAQGANLDAALAELKARYPHRQFHGLVSADDAAAMAKITQGNSTIKH